MGLINHLSFRGGKEGHGIVMRTARLRKKLAVLVHAKQFPKCVGLYIVGPDHCERSAAGTRFYSDMPDEKWR